MLCFKTDDGHGYHLLKAPLNNLYDDKALRNPTGAAADLARSNVLFKEYTHFVGAVRGEKGDMNLYVNGYLIARATPFSAEGKSMTTESFQLKGMFKETIDHPTHFFTIKKDNNTYTVGTANWNSDDFTPIGTTFSMTASKETNLSATQQTNKGVTSVISKVENVIPAKNMLAANRISLIIKPTQSQQQKLLAQFASNVGPSEDVDNTIGISIGKTQQYADPFEGFVKHVSVWNTALSQGDIITYMDRKKIESDSPNCVGFWKLEKDYKDSTSTQNNGTKNGNIAFVYKNQVLPLYIEEQHKTNWCWAATALSIIEYFDPMSRTMQKDIVKTIFGDETTNRGNRAENYLNRSTNLIENIYYNKNSRDVADKNFVTNADKTLDFDFLRTEIDNGKPIGMSVGWQGGGGHAIVLSGIEPKTNKLIINDPWSGLVFISYEDFINDRYSSTGHWRRAFTTQGKQVNPAV